MFSLLASIAFTPLIVSYTVEILPYEIRAKGLMIFNLSVSVSLIFNQYVNPIALGKLGWKYYVRLALRIFLIPIVPNVMSLQIVYCCWIAFELIFCCVYIIETKGLTLEETSALFDGHEAMEQIEQQAAAQASSDVREDEEKASQSPSSSKQEIEIRRA